MQDIEPFYNWREIYVSSEDERSPFFGREYSEFVYSNTIYNYYIHPQWDFMGSATLYLKTLFADYEQGFAVIEFIGEWNDAINNDVMTLKRDVIDDMIRMGIDKFILIGENVLNFHASDDCYYNEWFEDVGEGWIAAVNFRSHVRQEFERNDLDFFLTFGGELNALPWRTYNPMQLFGMVDRVIRHRLGQGSLS
jgi:hypothetical protein